MLLSADTATFQFVPSTYYINQSSLSVLHYISDCAKFTQIWIDARNLPQTYIKGAGFAVMFHIKCQIPYHTACLAYLLLRLSDENSRLNHYHPFHAVGLCYQFRRDGVYGTIFYDHRFQHCYSRAMVNSFLRRDGFSDFHETAGITHPSLTWFHNHASANADDADDLQSETQLMYNTCK